MATFAPSRLFALVGVAAALLAAPALAGTPVTLKANLTDASGRVTLGEIFDGAGAARDVTVAERSGPIVVLDAAAVRAFAARYGLDWANPQGLGRIIVRGGPAVEARNIEVLTYAHDITAGEVIQPSDLVWTKAVGPPVGAAAGVDGAVGLAARRPLRAGDPVLARDLTRPIVIRTGDSVQVTYAGGGVTLTLQGKAMAQAAAGQTLNVLNTVSKKMIEAVATGPGQAVVGPEAVRLRASREPSEIAFR